jgi:membrane protein
MPPTARRLDVARQIVRGALHHRLNGEAAKTAYYLFLSLFPLLLVAFAVTGLVGGHALFDVVRRRLEQATPPDAARYLEQFIRDATARRRPDILSVGILLALWTGSNIFTALAQGLNRIYEIKDRRRWWKRRLICLATLVAALVLFLGGAVILLAGGWIRDVAGLGRSWTVLRYPLAYALLSLLMLLVYWVLPDRDQRRATSSVVTGSLVGAAVWFLATVGFDQYITHVKDYGRLYGVVGAVIVLLLWLYLTAYAILFGGQVAAVLEQHRR